MTPNTDKARAESSHDGHARSRLRRLAVREAPCFLKSQEAEASCRLIPTLRAIPEIRLDLRVHTIWRHVSKVHETPAACKLKTPLTSHNSKCYV